MIVEKETELDFPLQDGSTKRQNYLWVYKQTGKMPPDLEVPVVHHSMRFIKECFDDLSMYRRFENGIPKPLSPQDIYYWCKLEGVELSKKHLKALKRLDVAQINKLVNLIQER